MPRKVVYRVGAGDRSARTVEDEFVRFEEVSGIKVPYQVVIRQEGRKFADVTVKEYKINPGLKIEDLSKRP